jgi:hypothetical protein
VVLLARDTPPNAPAVKDLGVDMSQWQPIVEDRMFVPWLVKPPGDDERLRARRLTPAQIGARRGSGLPAPGRAGAWGAPAPPRPAVEHACVCC